MATTKADLFHDDLHALMRKYGFEVGPDGSPLADAFYALHEAVEAALDAKGPALACDHCGALVTRLYAVREAADSLVSLCAPCRDGAVWRAAVPEEEDLSGEESELDAALRFERWANRGLGKW